MAREDSESLGPPKCHCRASSWEAKGYCNLHSKDAVWGRVEGAGRLLRNALGISICRRRGKGEGWDRENGIWGLGQMTALVDLTRWQGSSRVVSVRLRWLGICLYFHTEPLLDMGLPRMAYDLGQCSLCSQAVLDGMTSLSALDTKSFTEAESDGCISVSATITICILKNHANSFWENGLEMEKDTN